MENQSLDPCSFGLPLLPCQPGCQCQTAMIVAPTCLALRANGEALATGLMGSTRDSLQHQQGSCCCLKIFSFYFFLFHFPCAFFMKTTKPKPYSLYPLQMTAFYFSEKAYAIGFLSLIPYHLKISLSSSILLSFLLSSNKHSLFFLVRSKLTLGLSIPFPFTF